MTLIRPEREEDHPAVRELNRLAFGGEEEARIVDVLRGAASPLISLVAVRDERVVGHILFSPVETTPARKALGLGPMSVPGSLDGCSGVVKYRPEFGAAANDAEAS